MENKCIVIKELDLAEDEDDDYAKKNAEMEFLASKVLKKCSEEDANGMKRIVRIYDVYVRLFKKIFFLNIIIIQLYFNLILLFVEAKFYKFKKQLFLRNTNITDQTRK
jgi:cell division protein FtsL